jgi:hypothetical protein
MRCPSLALAVFATAFGGALGMRGSTKLTVGPNVVGSFYDFGFLAGGFASLSASQSAAGGDASAFMWVLLCSDAQVDADILRFASARELCAADLSGACSARAALGGGGAGNGSAWSVLLPVRADETLHFVYAACSSAGAAQTLEASWNCENPGGEALPAGFIPLKALTVGFGAAWAAAAGALAVGVGAAQGLLAPPRAWAAAAAAAARGAGDEALLEPQLARAARPLHAALAAAAAAFAAQGFLGGALWAAVSRAGAVPLALNAANVLVWDAASALLLGTVMALARGWQVRQASAASVSEVARGNKWRTFGRSECIGGGGGKFMGATEN